MIDSRDFTSSFPADSKDLVVYHDVYDGFGLVGHIRGGHAAVSLGQDTLLEPLFLELSDDRKRLYVDKCRVEVDPASLIDQKLTAPAGSIIIAPYGTSMIVKSRTGGTAYLGLHGKHLEDRYDGMAFSRWSLLRDRVSGTPALLFEFDSLNQSNPA